MLWDNLFEIVLLEPARQSGDELYIVAGYATATMVSRHFRELKDLNKEVKIELIVGMAAQDGIPQKDHIGFNNLVESQAGLFTCRYLAYSPPVHSKAYSWYSNGRPKVAYVGSANYTQQAFRVARREVMTEDDPQSVKTYFDLILQDTINCTDPQIDTRITIIREPRRLIGLGTNNGDMSDEEEPGSPHEDPLAELQHTNVNLLDNRGRLPQRSGLNWGQRPEYGREPNQAYIRLPMTVAKTDFFPPLKEVFTILTDDGKSMICVRAQDGAKAIHSTQSNSILGIYLRYRLGVPEGGRITKQHLEAYGRTDLDFYKIDEETYYMDFSVG